VTKALSETLLLANSKLDRKVFKEEAKNIKSTLDQHTSQLSDLDN
jgi:hypothetical protein